MKSNTIRKSIGKVIIAILLPIAVDWSSAQAQNEAAAGVQINVMRIYLKPAMTERFRALHLTQTAPNQRADGMPWRLTTHDIFGRSFEVTISTPLASFAELDDDNFVPTEIGAALFGESVDYRERLVVQTRPDMSIPGDGITGLRRMAYFQVRQGRIPDFEQFWTGTVLPAMRQRGIEGYQIFQTLIGGPQGQYIGGLWLQNYADLDSLGMDTLLTVDQQREFGDLVDEYTIKVQEVDRELSWGFQGL